jgi:hypothetical protein
MRIYYTPGHTPTLLDSFQGMNALHGRLKAFLSSGEESVRLEAEEWGDSAHYQELLGGLEIHKGDGPITLTLTPLRWLLLTGSPKNLQRYIGRFHFETDEDHHHPEYTQDEGYMSKDSMSLIIEVNSDWISDIRSKRH